VTSTGDVSGTDTSRVHGVGEIWREHIARPTGETAVADWIVTEADPGQRWASRGDGKTGPGW
jgi:hypothetical protein